MNYDKQSKQDLIDQVIDTFDQSLNDKQIELLRDSLDRIWNHGNKEFYSDFKSISDELPEIGRDIIGLTKDYEFKVTYLGKYNEWKCPITGGGLLVDIVKWKYE